MKLPKPKPRHYVNNKVLTREITEYQQACKAAAAEKRLAPRIPESIGRMFVAIATNRATVRNFSGYSFKEDMIADAVFNCVLRIHSFNPEKSTNAFAYYTTVVFNSFIHRIKAEKKQFDGRRVLADQAGIMDELIHTQDHDTTFYDIAAPRNDTEFNTGKSPGEND